MTSLTLILTTDWPDPRREACWLLHDADGRIVDRGYGPPADWPRPTSRPDTGDLPLRLDCDLLLAGSQVSIHDARLPDGAAGRQPEVLASLLDDRLLDEGDRLALVADDAGELIAVIRRNRLTALLERLGELGLNVRRAWPLHFSMDLAEALLVGDELNIRLPDGRGIAIPIDASITPWLATLTACGLPLPLPVARLDGQAVPESPVIGELSNELSWTAALPTPTVPSGAGFLYGPLAPRTDRGRHARAWRTPLRLAAGFLLAITLLGIADWWRMDALARNYRRQIAESFESAFPGGVKLDPIRQLRREVDRLGQNSSHPVSSDFLYLMQALIDAPELYRGLNSVDFETGRLRIISTSPVEGESLSARCRALALRCQTAPNGKDSSEIVISEATQP